MQSWISISGLTQDPPLTMKEITMVICNPDTWEIILEGTASMVDCIKVTTRSVYLDQVDSPPHPINVKWNISDEAADMLHIQTILDQLYHDQDIHR